ncbi:MAG: DNA translocase FtsK 4TM domain-containing protein, partial [Bryobacteraceae bacterium]|nr:DNA translocase FtsK 4TM domain-containing protein [Bryobacteraceae bacterium]
MKVLGPTRHRRLNEGAGLVLLAFGIALICALVSFHPLDSSWNTATGSGKPVNLMGRVGAIAADALLQLSGVGSFTIPLLLVVLAWKWFRSDRIEAQFFKVTGALTLIVAVCTALSLGPTWRPFGGAVAAGGLVGRLAADYLVSELNLFGAILATAFTMVLALYIVSAFSLTLVWNWLEPLRNMLARIASSWRSWNDRRRHQREERKANRIAQTKAVTPSQPVKTQKAVPQSRPEPEPFYAAESDTVAPPWTVESTPASSRLPQPEPVKEDHDEIPIHAIEDYQPVAAGSLPPPPPPAPERPPVTATPAPRTKTLFRIPSTDFLQEPQARPPYDTQELKDIAAKIKSKFEEFNVTGSVTQINPGPVVTTFEYKPEAGVKYSRITNLTEDLCLGLQAESILIERIPGKPTVGIEVPNSRRETISLRQVLESDEFQNSPSPLTISLGKDISGRIKVAALDSMPHLLIAGSTGSGKSVMLNTMIMSILYKATPDDVRMIMVDPKRVELGIYEGIPHLLTPVITDPRKATNALRNAVLEMERRLKLLASQGARNIDQFNKKVRLQQASPRSLFEQTSTSTPPDLLEPLPYILIIIDELADLMMLERQGVEESVTRLAQMSRAVGMHLVLATQRPSVDVITGLIKANFPARLSFRVATRVDSRTILDVMGAEHLLGKGDMLFLPPGSSRLTRVHGAYVGESEIEHVVEDWKIQATPEYDSSYLIAPPSSDDGAEPEEDFEGDQDPLYQDAVRVVLEMGKASTSTLQRRLRLGYGRAARILDMMQREGIIGPPDGP